MPHRSFQSLRDLSPSFAAGAIFVVAVFGVRPTGQVRPDLSGAWTLNRNSSQFPREVGFDADWLEGSGNGNSEGVGGASGGGTRGGRSGGSGGGSVRLPTPSDRPLSEEDSRKLHELVDEVKSPPAQLVISRTDAAIAVVADSGRVRVLHPDGKEDTVYLNTGPIAVVTTWEGVDLLVRYRIDKDQELRYRYSRDPGAARLVVRAQLASHGRGDVITRVYDAGPAAPARTIPAAAPPTRSAPGAGTAVAPSPADGPSAQAFNQRPDAELRGLTKLGVVVEDLGPQAAECGLSQAPLEDAVSKRLSNAGLTVLRNSDEDTYLYVHVITTTLATGLCVSRYDVILYTHTTTKLSYQETPVLVEVSLLHKGGISGSAASAHAEGILRLVQESVDQFSTRIRDANK